MTRNRKLLLLFSISAFVHFGLSLYWLSRAIECGASNTCADWINWTDYVVGFPIFDFLRLVEGGGSHSSGEMLFALLPANSVLVSIIITALGSSIASRRGRPRDL